MSLVSMVLGRVSPRWRTLNEWLDVHEGIVRGRDYSPQTIKNKMINVRHLRRLMGDETLRSIRPVTIITAVRTFLPDRAPTAQRVLAEARDALAEAVNNGWVDANPALAATRPTARVTRQRLAVDRWLHMLKIAEGGTIKWLRILLLLAVITGQRRGDLAAMKFSDIWDGHLHIEQLKKAGKPIGARVAIPLTLRLDVVDMSLGELIELCRTYATPGTHLLRKKNGAPFKRPEMLSYRFEECINQTGGVWKRGQRPSLHECRSLSSRLYKKQGIDTKTLLGHKSQLMTDKYNDDRGLDAAEWNHVLLEVA